MKSHSVRPSDEVQLKAITKMSDIEKAHKVWPNYVRFPVEVIEHAAKYRENVGAFLDDGTLVAWVFR